MKALNLLLVLTLISAFYSRECEGLAQKHLNVIKLILIQLFFIVAALLKLQCL